MDLLLIDDASRYLDLGKAEVFELEDGTYYRSEHGEWARKGPSDRFGQLVSEPEAFKALMRAGKFTDAQKQFSKMFNAAAHPLAQSTAPTYPPRQLTQLVAGGALGIALVAYLVAILTNLIPVGQRVGIGDLAVVVVGIVAILLIVRPRVLEHIAVFRLGNLEIQLNEVRKGQEATKAELAETGRLLEQIRFALELALSPNERKHLQNLNHRPPVEYEGNESVRTELRRLRFLGLIQSKRYIGQIPNGQRVDLHEFVELTPRGREYLAGIAHQKE